MAEELHVVWRDYRARRRAVVLVALAYFPLVRWLGAWLDQRAGSGVPHCILASAWMTAAAAAVVWLAAFRCPFCHLHFHWTWWISNPFTKQCLHCGFKKWRDPEAARAYTRG